MIAVLLPTSNNAHCEDRTLRAMTRKHAALSMSK